MARPIKQGLEYFPLDVNLDNKLELIEAKFGMMGFAIIIKLLQSIYKEGYFLEISEEIMLLMGKRFNIEVSQLSEVINYSISHGLFDKTKYETYNILTSNGVQKRFLEATGRRKKVELIKEYLINDDVYKDNVYIKSISADFNTQSKEKESKENLKERENDFFKIDILRKFHKKKFQNVLNEFDRFFAHYQKTGWVDANGNKIIDKLSAAECWVEKPNHEKQSGKNKTSPLQDIWHKLISDFLQIVKSEEAAKLILSTKILRYENSMVIIKLNSENDFNLLENKYFQEFQSSVRKYFPEPIQIKYNWEKQAT